ncbi:MAG: hypothetical protein M5U09_11945 [Gammaproteobacteria bacterium]|nr:hypothetical protein [Gammaproteobacteria bacterium]
MPGFARTAVVAALLALPAAAGAASIIELAGTSNNEPISNTIEVNGNRLRMIVREAGATSDVLFDASADTARVIDHAERTYMEITAADVERMGASLKGMVSEIRAQLEQTMAGMSEEQKAQLGGLLGNLGLEQGAGNTAPQEVARFEPTGEPGRVADIPCNRGVLKAGDTVRARLCVANRADIAVPDAEYATLRRLVAFGSRIAGTMAEVFPGMVADMPSFDVGTVNGLPVEIVDPATRVAVREVRAEPRPPITLPEGYKRRANPLLGM